MSELSHVDQNNLPTMVDISSKQITLRVAKAKCFVKLPAELKSYFNGKDYQVKKGPVFQTAIIAGNMAVKKTSELIPFCHPIMLESIKIEIIPIDELKIEITCTVKNVGKTGVEMEALTGATVTALTIYDMCKAVSHEIIIENAYLIEKSGGKRNVKEGKLCD